MGNSKQTVTNSAETVYLIRHWYEEDGTPCFLLETVQTPPRRRLFAQFSQLTAYLATVMPSHKDLTSTQEIIQ